MFGNAHGTLVKRRKITEVDRLSRKAKKMSSAKEKLGRYNRHAAAATENTAPPNNEVRAKTYSSELHREAQAFFLSRILSCGAGKLFCLAKNSIDQSGAGAGCCHK
jgi:hypothetical protein